MGIILWIIFGAVVGWIASLIMKSNYGVIVDIIVGVVGAVVGGYLMGLAGQPGITGFNIYSMIVAIIGACVAVFIVRLLKRG